LPHIRSRNEVDLAGDEGEVDPAVPFHFVSPLMPEQRESRHHPNGEDPLIRNDNRVTPQLSEKAR
jgi:hypothetical protein